MKPDPQFDAEGEYKAPELGLLDKTLVIKRGTNRS